MKNKSIFSYAATTLWLISGSVAQAQDEVDAVDCIQDLATEERFLPVELITGHPLPSTHVLSFEPVQKRVYPFISASPNLKGKMAETSLDGPYVWVGHGGKEYEIYERKVPRAHERFAMTKDQSSVGRVYDERWGNATNEGKFPVGIWKQGEKRSYQATYHTTRGDLPITTTIEIEKLSCTYQGINDSVQFRWTTSRGLNYVYVLTPERGLVQAVVYRRGS